MKITSHPGSRNLLLFAERLALAIASFATIIVASRILDERGFGTLTTILAIWFFAEIVLVSIIVEPLIWFSGTLRQNASLNGAWLTLSVATITALTIICAGAAYLTLSPHEYGGEVAVNLLHLLPAYGFFHTIRRLLTLHAGRRASFTGVMVLCVVLLAAIAALYTGALAASVFSICTALSLSHFLGTLAGLLAARLPVRFSKSYFRAVVSRLWRRREAALSSFIVKAPGIGLFGWALGALAGPLETARFFASRTLMRPVGILVTALNDGGRNDAAHALGASGQSGLTSWYQRNRSLAFYANLPVLAILFLFPEAILELLFGGKFSDVAGLVRLWCVVYVLRSLLLPRSIYMLTSGKEKTLMRIGLGAVGAAFLVIATGMFLTGASPAVIFILADLAMVAVQFALIEFVLRSQGAMRGF